MTGTVQQLRNISEGHPYRAKSKTLSQCMTQSSHRVGHLLRGQGYSNPVWFGGLPTVFGITGARHRSYQAR